MAGIVANPEALARVNARQAYARARAINVKLAREDAHTFNSLVLRDERTNKKVKPVAAHGKIHEILDNQPNVVITSFVEFGKSSAISIGRSLFELGRNPDLRVCVISKTQNLAKKLVRAAAQYITRSEDIREIFPELKPSTRRDQPWNSLALTVERPSFAMKEPSLQACGVHGNIGGARVDLLILDDILDADNTSTEHGRNDVWEWLEKSVMNRLADDSRVWALTNAWHPKDAMHRLAKTPTYVSYSFPVLDKDGNSAWPEMWPKKRIEQWRLTRHPAEFQRALMCVSRSDEASMIKQAWIDVALRAGDGYRMLDSLEGRELPPGFCVVTGVDLASSLSESADITVLFTVLVHPTGHLQPLHILSGRISGPDIISAIEEVNRKFGGTFIVENNGAQEYILQFAKAETRAALFPFTTGKNKVNPQWGVASLGADLNNGTWIVPNKSSACPEGIQAWIEELLAYDPREHTGDHIMASWFVREYVRKVLGLRVHEDDIDPTTVVPDDEGTDLGIRVIGE